MRCNICRGIGKHAPLGGIEIKCSVCAGVGHVVDSVVAITKEIKHDQFNSNTVKSMPLKADKPVFTPIVKNMVKGSTKLSNELN